MISCHDKWFKPPIIHTLGKRHMVFVLKVYIIGYAGIVRLACVSIFLSLLSTANVLSVEYTDVCLRSRFKNKHRWFLHVFVSNWLQLFSCCFYISSKAKSTGKLVQSLAE